MQLENFISTYDANNWFNDHDCWYLTNLFNEYKDDIEVHDTPGYKFDQLNLNKIRPDIAQEFAKMCNGFANHYFTMKRYGKFIPKWSFEEVRMKRYLANDGEFKPHVDVVDHASAKRFLTFIMYLNTNNGLTEFTNLDYSMKPEIGKVLVFPPTWMFPHVGKTPTDSNKFILMTSLTYI